MNKNNIKKLEEFIRIHNSKRDFSKILLFILALGATPGLVFVGSAMGNAVKILKMFDKNKKYTKQQIKNGINYLHRKKLIEYISEKGGVTKVAITKEGKNKLRYFSIESLKLQKQNKWDGKWRLVMFDLPLKYKSVRNSLRYKLKQIGFIQLQKSVWIYPYPCTDEILFISDYYKINKYIEILTAEIMINDNKLKTHFGLK